MRCKKRENGDDFAVFQAEQGGVNLYVSEVRYIPGSVLANIFDNIQNILLY
jgi:hypothetical protein